MYQGFDKYNQFEKPNIILCNPNKDELYSLNMARDLKVSYKFNAMSEISFVIDSSVNGVSNPAYPYVQSKRIVKIDNLGYFIISEPEEDLSTTNPFKTVVAFSLESEMVHKKLTSFSGTFQFYNPMSPSGTLLDRIVELIPNWSVGSVDSELWTKYRTFDISDTNVYNFLMEDVETAYGCVFIFDTINRTISAKTTDNATTETDIFISKENLIKSASLKEISSEIVTAMAVFGGGELNIRGVNPLGGNYIYNFSYYKSTDWMSQSLVDAITNWENQIVAYQPSYSLHLEAIYSSNEDLLSLRSQLSDLNSEYLALEGVQKVRIETGQSYSDITSQMEAKQVEIDSKENEINNKQIQINSLNEVIESIVNTLSFENNFTQSQILELQPFIIENTYQNKNIIQTDSMTVTQIQDQAQSLYEDAITVLSKSSQPRYEFSIETSNFVLMKDFQEFTEQLELGCIVTINAKNEEIIQSVLLEININYNDPTDFSLVFSNRLRLDNSSYIFSDLFGSQNKASSSVDFKALSWDNWNADYKDEVSTFITSSLDASLNNIVNASNQEILINQNGLRGKRFITETQTYSPNQVWLTSQTLAFTKDNWQTASLAIGQISHNSQEVYGVVADAIVGRIIAGNQLSIANSSNNFLLDNTGAYLNNAKFTLTTQNSRILLDPSGTYPFSIEQNAGGTWTYKFLVDNTGNVSMVGAVTANSGYIGGIGISDNIPSIGVGGIYKTSDPANYYIANNGDLKWGNLSIIGNNATFTGDIYANKLIGAVSYNQLTDIPAEKITTGTMSGSRISGGTAYPTNITMPSGGQLNLGSASLYSYGSNFEIIAGGNMSISSASGGSISAGSFGVNLSGGSLYIYNSGIYVSGGYSGWGKNAAIYLTNYGKYMYFSNGILTGW